MSPDTMTTALTLVGRLGREAPFAAAFLSGCNDLGLSAARTKEAAARACALDAVLVEDLAVVRDTPLDVLAAALPFAAKTAGWGHTLFRGIGGVGGGILGSIGGSFASPVAGTIAGGVGGGMAGDAAGGWLADKLFGKEQEAGADGLPVDKQNSVVPGAAVGAGVVGARALARRAPGMALAARPHPAGTGAPFAPATSMPKMGSPALYGTKQAVGIGEPMGINQPVAQPAASMPPPPASQPAAQPQAQPQQPAAQPPQPPAQPPAQQAPAPQGPDQIHAVQTTSGGTSPLQTQPHGMPNQQPLQPNQQPTGQPGIQPQPTGQPGIQPQPPAAALPPEQLPQAQQSQEVVPPPPFGDQVPQQQPVNAMTPLPGMEVTAATKEAFPAIGSLVMGGLRGVGSALGRWGPKLWGGAKGVAGRMTGAAPTAAAPAGVSAAEAAAGTGSMDSLKAVFAPKAPPGILSRVGGYAKSDLGSQALMMGGFVGIPPLLESMHGPDEHAQRVQAAQGLGLHLSQAASLGDEGAFHQAVSAPGTHPAVGQALTSLWGDPHGREMLANQDAAANAVYQMHQHLRLNPQLQGAQLAQIVSHQKQGSSADPKDHRAWGPTLLDGAATGLGIHFGIEHGGKAVENHLTPRLAKRGLVPTDPFTGRPAGPWATGVLPAAGAVAGGAGLGLLGHGMARFLTRPHDKQASPADPKDHRDGGDADGKRRRSRLAAPAESVFGPVAGFFTGGKGHRVEGIGRGTVAGAGTGLGMSAGAALGAAAGSATGSPTASLLGLLGGGALGGYLGHRASHAVMGHPSWARAPGQIHHTPYPAPPPPGKQAALLSRDQLLAMPKAPGQPLPVKPPRPTVPPPGQQQQQAQAQPQVPAA